MRCSAWSSLAISVCSCAGALALATPAAAHVYATPSFVPGGKTATLSLSVPNERGVPMTGVTVTVPDGFRVLKALPVGGWQTQVTRSIATWSGRGLPARGLANITLDVRARTSPGDVALLAKERYRDGGIVQWPVNLTVVPGAEPSQNLGIALIVGLLGLVVVTAVVVVFWQRRLRSLQGK
jgi:uncharacterized protein YcnI